MRGGVVWMRLSARARRGTVDEEGSRERSVITSKTVDRGLTGGHDSREEVFMFPQTIFSSL